jgi:predicted phage-related endonuclease
MKWFRKFWPYVLLVILLACNVLVWVERQNIADWWKLRNYTAPAEISSLASETTMTDYAKRLFYVNHPVLEDKQAFNEHCSDKSEETAVLGCYHGNRRGIYLYAVTDPRLDGVRQVTAAHEMLHQAYDRLSASEKERISGLLDDFYKNHLEDESIKTKIDNYNKQGAELDNEMHSIFATEVRELTPELEEYYGQYFTDRVAIVTYSEAYQAEFTRRKEQVKAYDAQLSSLKDQIDTNKRDLKSKLSILKDKEKEINQDVADRNQAEYQADVAEYNQMVEVYNSELADTRALISEYNDIVAARNDIAVQEQELQEALDSRLNEPAKQ